MARYLILAALLFGAPFTQAQQDTIRVDMRLVAADLTDELVHTWLQNAPFAGPTNLILAEVDGPIGLDQRFDQDIENHLYELLRANPRLPVQLVHCSLCRQWVTVSNPKRTVMGRALNQPEAAEQLKRYPHLHALSLHFDVVERDLVLWAEIYEVAPPQRVVWSQRYSQQTSARTILREPNRLISIPEARLEQRRILEGREGFQTVTRFPIRMFKANSNVAGTGGGIEVPPLIFLEQSFEAVLSPRRNRRAGLQLGLTSIKSTMQGWSFGANFQQLLFRNEPSLTEPDLYLKAAVNYIRLEGPGAAVFGQNQIDVARLINANDDPRAAMTAFQIGLEAHVKYRFGFSAFIEYIPSLDSSQVVGTYNFGIPFHSFGVAGVFLW